MIMCMISHTHASVGLVHCTICQQTIYNSSWNLRNSNVFKTAHPYTWPPSNLASMSSPVKLSIQFNCYVFLMFKAVLCVDLKYDVNKLGMKGFS